METNREILLSVVLPCRNEEDSLGKGIDDILKTFYEYKISGEVIVSDSSTDNSPNIAREKGVILVSHDKDGYGNAYLEGFKHAKGKYVFMADPDSSYDFKEIPSFLEGLKEGNDFIIGNRFKGTIEKGAMPLLHKYFGNPFLSFVFSVLFWSRMYDAHCGMRAIKNSKLKELNLQTTGMEFASEMLIKVIRNDLKIKELPINYYCRQGVSKMRSFRDGWRHLRFMLLYSPIFLFFIPGLVLFTVGVLSLGRFYFGQVSFLGFEFVFHPMFVSSLLVIIGYQMIFFSLFSKVYMVTHLMERDKLTLKLLKYFNLERGLILGFISILTGLVIFIVVLMKWVNLGFGELNEIKNSLVAMTFLAIGIQTIFASFMMSILGIKEK